MGLHRIAVAIGFALSLVLPVHAQLLEYEDVLENLTGAWGIPHGEEGSRVTDCSILRIRLRIEDRDGMLYYVARHEGSDADGYPPHEQPVERAYLPDGRALPALLIEYEGEERLDEDGQPVKWWLFMIGKDHFAWSAAHWNLQGFTPLRTRCEETEIVS